MGKEQGQAFIIMAVIVLACSILSVSADCIIDISLEDTPYSVTLNHTAFEEPGSSGDLAYGPYLSGPPSAEFISGRANIRLAVNIPETVSAGIIETGVFVGGNRQALCIEVREKNMSIETDKEYYHPNESVFLRISAPRGSRLQLNITSAGFSKNFSTIAEEENVLVFVPETLGEFRIMARTEYDDHVWISEDEFLVMDKLSCQARDLSAYSGEPAKHEALVYGGMKPYFFRWRIENRTFTEESPAVLYNSLGSFPITLTVEDALGQIASCTATARITERSYQLKIMVLDEETGGRIGDALIQSVGKRVKSNINGLAFMDLPAESHRLSIRHDLYLDQELLINVTEDYSISVNLKRKPASMKNLPKITLIKPDDGIHIKQSQQEFEYIVESDSDIESCVLLVNKDNNLGMLVKGRQEKVPSGRKQSFTTDLINGNFKWSVRCDNKIGEGISEERHFKVSGLVVHNLAETKEVAEKSAPKTDLSKDIESMMSDLNSIETAERYLEALGPAEKRAAQILDLKISISQQKMKMNALKNDMESLQYLQISPQDRETKRKQYLSSFKELSGSVVVSVLVKDIDESSGRTSQPKQDEAIEEYLERRGISLSKGAKKKFVKEARSLNNEIIVESAIMAVELGHRDGSRSPLGLIERRIIFNGNISSADFVEMIPKDVAEDMRSVQINRPYELLGDGPVFSIDIKTSKQYNYVIKSDAQIEKLRDIKYLLVPRFVTESPTGFSVYSDLGTGSLIFVLLAAVLVAGYYTTLSDEHRKKALLDTIKSIRQAISSIKPKGRAKKLKERLGFCLNLLEHGMHEEAFAQYGKVLDLYNKAPEEVKHESREAMCLLGHELELYCLNSAIDKAKQQICSTELGRLESLHKDIEKRYESLPEKQKAAVKTKYVNYCLAYRVRQIRAEPIQAEQSINDAIFQKKI